jgi:hypothetical protein
VGGVWFLDQNLRTAVGRDFVKSGSTMLARFAPERLIDVLRAIYAPPLNQHRW